MFVLIFYFLIFLLDHFNEKKKNTIKQNEIKTFNQKSIERIKNNNNEKKIQVIDKFHDINKQNYSFHSFLFFLQYKIKTLTDLK